MPRRPPIFIAHRVSAHRDTIEHLPRFYREIAEYLAEIGDIIVLPDDPGSDT